MCKDDQEILHYSSCSILFICLFKNRISGLNDFYRINLNDVRRAGAHDDGVFNECKINDQESDDDVASINSKDHGDDDDADDDDDDD